MPPKDIPLLFEGGIYGMIIRMTSRIKKEIDAGIP
jgi:hypothetical protein